MTKKINHVTKNNEKTKQKPDKYQKFEEDKNVNGSPKKINEKIKPFPSDFYEVLFKYEVQLSSKNITIGLIRKLTYLYTFAAGYFDKENKKDYQNHFLKKLNELLRDEDVNSYLEQYELIYDNEKFSKKNFNEIEIKLHLGQQQYIIYIINSLSI